MMPTRANGRPRRCCDAVPAGNARPLVQPVLLESAVVSVPTGYRVDRWAVDAPIANGAWSTVYRGRRIDEPDADPVALKFIAVAHLSPQQRTHAIELARRETAARLEHRTIIRMLATIVIEDAASPALDGSVVIVMECAERSVRDVLATAEPGQPIPGAGALLADVADALAAVHSAGWVHGDVKPANVLVMADGSARLGDFGLAGELEGTHAYLPMLGTEDHLPPEWWTERVSVGGVPARPARDVWSFGVLAHQVLSGGLHPFAGASPRARSASARSYAAGEEPLRLSDAVSGPWATLVADCLAPKPGDRPSSRRISERISELAAPRRSRRRFVAVGAGLAVAIAAGVGVLLVGVAGDDDPTSTTRPFSGGELRVDAAVPAALREPIEDAAHGCADPAVTPALIAAMARAETNFDADARSPETDEYGIVLWTPSVFEEWQVDADGGGPSVFSAEDSIAALGKFLCGVVDRNRHIPGDLALTLAAVYRVGGQNVRAVNGIPPSATAYVEEVGEYIGEFTEPGT
jgi:eukaryotic-like serine/threonine-protein kinase